MVRVFSKKDYVTFLDHFCKYRHANETLSNVEFNFQQQLLAYCESDVEILAKCCLLFRDLFLQVTQVDPFSGGSLTIASACNRVFRQNFLHIATIGIVPHGGYRRNELQSIIALKWLKWLATEQNVKILHKLNGGEQRIGPFKVDGLCDKTVYEFYGCYWHGCPKCMSRRHDPVITNDTTADEAYQVIHITLLIHCF